MNGQSHISGLAACALSALLFLLSPSCTNLDLASGADAPGAAGGKISFGLTSASRAAAETVVLATDSLMLRSDDAADSLAVSVSVTEGISAAAPASRAAAVSASNFYDTFHVLAYHTVGATLQSAFFMDEDVTKGTDDLWSSAVDYYWSGSDVERLQFLAWAPSSAFTKPTDSGNKLLADYTVPADVAKQEDVVVAMTDSYGGAQGNALNAVPLNFKHLCTAVRFVVGDEMQAGTIKSITLRGIKSKGSYDVAAVPFDAWSAGANSVNAWTLDDTATDFTLTLDKTVNGTSAAPGSAITSDAQTFMMLPQTFADGAEIEVKFLDDKSNTERTLRASLAGTEWPINTTVTYSISITPEAGFIITVPTEPQDAHYITFDITVDVKDYEGAWTLTSNFPGDVTFTTTKTALQEQGYWIEDDKGQPSISGNGSGTFTYHVYVTENVVGSTNTEDAPRDIEFTLTPTAPNTNAKPVTATVKQLNPSWSADGTLGCERIEGKTYPWGFMWENEKITYDVSNIDWLNKALLRIYLMFFNNSDFVTSPFGSGKVFIDFSKVNAPDVALDNTNGIANTDELYNYNGVNDASNMINWLESVGAKPDKPFEENPTEFAARACVMKNRFIKETTSGVGGASVETPKLLELKWYLPARNEAPKMQDSEHQLSGTYWTSTAVDDNQHAYIWTVGQASADNMDLRKAPHNVRAVRAKP